MEQVLSDLKLIWNAVLDSTAPLWASAVEAFATMPDWLLAALGAGVLALAIVLIVGGRRMRGQAGGNGEYDMSPVMAPPVPRAPQPADGGTRTAADDEGEDILSRPEIQGLAEVLEQQGLGGAALTGRLTAFAHDLDDLHARLEDLAPGVSGQRLADLHDARTALTTGDLARSADLLVRIGDAEDTAGAALMGTAGRHGRSAALLRLVAGDLRLAQEAPGNALTLYRRALEAAPADAVDLRVECLARLGALHHGDGDAAAARDAFAEAVRIIDEAAGGRAPGKDGGESTHPDLGALLGNLGLACDILGDRPAAERHYQRALAADERAFGREHPNVAVALNNLGLLYKREGKPQAAEPLLRRALNIKETLLPAGDPSLTKGLLNYGATLRDLGREADAAELEARAGAVAADPRPAEAENPLPRENSGDALSPG